MANDRAWFAIERSEALALLLLTSRPDLNVKREENREDGIDFVVALKDPNDVPPTRLFVVQVKGSLSSDPRKWNQSVKPLFNVGGDLYLPVCVFVVNVRDNTAAYAWIAKPLVKKGTARLEFFEQPEFLPLDEAAVAQIVDQVRRWYDAMPRSLVSHAS